MPVGALCGAFGAYAFNSAAPKPAAQGFPVQPFAGGTPVALATVGDTALEGISAAPPFHRDKGSRSIGLFSPPSAKHLCGALLSMFSRLAQGRRLRLPTPSHRIGVWIEERLPHAPYARSALDLAWRRGAGTVSLVFLNGEKSWAQARHADIDRVVTFRLDDIPPAFAGTVPTIGAGSVTSATSGIENRHLEGPRR